MRKKLWSIVVTIAILITITLPASANTRYLAANVLNDETFLNEATIVETENDNVIILSRSESINTRSSTEVYKSDIVQLYLESQEQKDVLFEAISSTDEHKTVEGMDGGYTVAAYTTIYYTLYRGTPGTADFLRVEGGYDVRSSQVQVTSHKYSVSGLANSPTGAFGYENTLPLASSEWTHTFPNSLHNIDNAEMYYTLVLYTITIERGFGSWDFVINNRLNLGL